MIDGLSIHLTPVAPEVELVRRGNVLVAVHKTDEPWPWTDEEERDVLEAVRERRIR